MLQGIKYKIIRDLYWVMLQEKIIKNLFLKMLHEINYKILRDLFLDMLQEIKWIH